MSQNIVGDIHQSIRGKTLPHLMLLAASNKKTIAYVHHSDHQEVEFLTYLEGTASPIWESWPIYVREDVLNPLWKVGSNVKIGEIDAQASVRMGMWFDIMYNLINHTLVI